MKILVLGAAGRTGRLVVSKALDAGHDVVAFVRDPAHFDIEDARLQVAVGNVHDCDSLAAAMRGVDVVISAVGPAGKSSAGVMTATAGHAIDAMRETGARRLIFVTGAGVEQPEDVPVLASRIVLPLMKLFARELVEDALNAVETIKASEIDWVVVRAPRLDDSPAAGTYRTGYIKPSFRSLSREDLADFCLAQLSDDANLRRAPIITN